MIQLHQKLAAPAPNKLTTDGKAESDLLKANYDAGERDFKFKADIYGHPQVKDSLLTLQNGKCCFCEAQINHVSYGDVEHFRPKGGWIQDSEPLNTPGYYWLAYDWENLFLSCQLCNQRFKKNYFPLENNVNRAKSHHDNISSEAPLFIHLTNENPEDFICFKDEIPVAINGNLRGDTAIKHTGIDRGALNENRRTNLNPIRDLYELAKGIPETNPDLQQKAWNKVKKYFDESKLDSTEYASMLRSFFKANPLP
jgi:uncharacterized protein (TIGR02646 family)